MLSNFFNKNLFYKFKDCFVEILNYIYKQKCVACGCSQPDKILCTKCSQLVHKLSPYAQRIILNVHIFSGYKYENSVQKLIKNLKFNHNRRSAKACAYLLFEYFKDVVRENNLDINPKNTIIVPIPSHKLRSLERGYCHLELITKEFSNLSSIECDFNLIKKVKNTRSQYKVRANQRAKNVRGAFRVNIDNKSEKTILLIDDLVTTGATLEEVIGEIKKYKNNKIICITLACA